MNADNGASPLGHGFHLLGGIQPRSAPDQALALLLDGLRAGMYEIGDGLPPLRQLATELGVSHVVARQAIEVLVTCGVFEVRTGRNGGIFVVGFQGIPKALTTLYQVPDRPETIALLQARRLVETHIAREVAAQPKDEDLTDLGAIVDRLEATRDVAEFVELTVRFNLRLAVAAGNPLLTGFLREILNRMAIVGLKRGKAAPQFTTIEPGVKIYRSLYESLRSRDVANIPHHVEEHMHLIAQIYQLDEQEWRPPSGDILPKSGKGSKAHGR